MITLKVRCSQCGAPVRKSDLVTHQVWPKSVIIAIISYHCRHLSSLQQNIITTMMYNHWIICEFFLKLLHVTEIFSMSTACDALDIMYGWCHTTHNHHVRHRFANDSDNTLKKIDDNNASGCQNLRGQQNERDKWPQTVCCKYVCFALRNIWKRLMFRM